MKYYLPSFFKIAGIIIVVIALAILVFLLSVRYYFEMIPQATQIIMFDKFLFVSGLLLINFSNEKTENESTASARLQAFILSIVISIIIMMIFEFISFYNQQVPLQAIDFVIIQMCLYYIFFRLKR